MMRTPKYKNLAVLVVTFLFILACAIPGIGEPVAAPIDPSTLPTIIALTASAAMTQTAVANAPAGQGSAGNPLLPPTSEVSVINLEILPDGATKFTHVNGGYEVTFPQGWLNVRPASEEFAAAQSKEAKNNTLLLEQMNADMENYDEEFDQLYSYALRPDIEKDTLFGFSRLAWDSSDTYPLDEGFMGEFVRDLESSTINPGFRADTAQVYESPAHIKLVEIGGQFVIGDEEGGVIPFYATFIFFKPTHDTLTRIDFTYLKDFKPEISSDVIDVINSIKLLDS